MQLNRVSILFIVKKTRSVHELNQELPTSQILPNNNIQGRVIFEGLKCMFIIT